MGCILESAIFSLVREVCFGVACQSSAWVMSCLLPTGSQDSSGWKELQEVSCAGNVL